jgi:hypothetical protein
VGRRGQAWGGGRPGLDALRARGKTLANREKSERFGALHSSLRAAIVTRRAETPLGGSGSASWRE